MPSLESNSTTKIHLLSAELQKKAESELNEDPKRIEEDLKHIKEWLTKQPHLTARQDDHFLLCFLRGTKFSLQKAKEKLDYFHTVKTMLPEFYTNRDPFASDIQQMLKLGAVLPLPQAKGLTGPRPVLIRWGICNPATIPYHSIAKLFYMVIDILMQEDDNTNVSGLHFIIDCKDFPPGYLLQCTPTAVHKAAMGVKSAYPLRIERIDFINVPSIFDVIFTLVKSMLTQKLRDRSNSYSENTISNFYKQFPQELFPEELGGKGERVKITTERWKKKVESYRQWFDEDAAFCSNEKLRPEESDSDTFGTSGTFRKLAID